MGKPWGRVATGALLVVIGGLTLTIDPRIALAFLAVGVFLLLWATGLAAA